VSAWPRVAPEEGISTTDGEREGDELVRAVEVRQETEREGGSWREGERKAGRQPRRAAGRSACMPRSGSCVSLQHVLHVLHPLRLCVLQAIIGIGNTLLFPPATPMLPRPQRSRRPSRRACSALPNHPATCASCWLRSPLPPSPPRNQRSPSSWKETIHPGPWCFHVAPMSCADSIVLTLVPSFRETNPSEAPGLERYC